MSDETKPACPTLRDQVGAWIAANPAKAIALYTAAIKGRDIADVLKGLIA